MLFPEFESLYIFKFIESKTCWKIWMLSTFEDDKYTQNSLFQWLFPSTYSLVSVVLDRGRKKKSKLLLLFWQSQHSVSGFPITLSPSSEQAFLQPTPGRFSLLQFWHSLLGHCVTSDGQLRPSLQVSTEGQDSVLFSWFFGCECGFLWHI